MLRWDQVQAGRALTTQYPARANLTGDGMDRLVTQRPGLQSVYWSFVEDRLPIRVLLHPLLKLCQASLSATPKARSTGG